MSNPTNSDLSGPHHYPPTTAEWVTSPLASQEELQREFPEPASNSEPSLRLGALLLMGGGLLALAVLFLQFAEITSLVTWQLWLVALIGLTGGATAFALGAAARGLSLLVRLTSRYTDHAIFLAFASVALQIIDAVILVIFMASGHRQMHHLLGVRAWMAAASVLCLLLGGSILSFFVQPHVSRQELAEQAEKDNQMIEPPRRSQYFGLPF